LTTWTPHALASESRRYTGEPWRVVEAQHTASTMRLADSIAEQHLLETILEQSKPSPAPGTSKLHYLLATPFRYRPAMGSRFRAPLDAGVWYGAEELRTSLAEKSYWRLKFLLDSPATPDLRPVPHTAFRAQLQGSAIDLTRSPMVADRATWTNRGSYAATQALGVAAREATLAIIRYESVRDPERAACCAVLTPSAFKRTTPRSLETWFIAASRARVSCAKSTHGPTWEFSCEQLTGEAS
jgi:hypothetical protein